MNIVLITDCIENSKIDINRRDLEGNSKEQNDRMIKSIKPLAEKFYHYTSINEFEKNIFLHKKDIILPLFYGINGNNQKSILPTLCELHNLNYVGADAYTHTICNDKNLSKLYAKQFDIKSANSILLQNESQLNNNIIKHLNLPIIIKPNYGGGSVGIANENLVYTYKDAVNMTKKILKNHQIPVLLEEYIPGYEVELILLGNKKNISFCKEVQLIINKIENFNKQIWGLETKKIDDSLVEFKLSNYINEKDRNNLIKLFQSFNKIEFARIDGRIYNNEFYLIEISPDCYLGDDCAFYYAFSQNNISHTEMFEKIIKNHLEIL